MTTQPSPSQASTPRQLADRFVHNLADLNPALSTMLGLRPHEDGLPDLSPDGYAAQLELARRTLAELSALEQAEGSADRGWDDLERRCADLLRTNLTAEMESFAAGDHLRAIRNIFSPAHMVRQLFSLMPTSSHEDWAALARRLHRVAGAYQGWTRTLDQGIERGLFSAPRQVRTVIEQMEDWLSTRWFHQIITSGPEQLQEQLGAGADSAHEATAALRDYLRDVYLPAAAETPDAVGEERYRRASAASLGSPVDARDAYAWGWAEFQRIAAEMRELAEKIRPGSTPVEVMRHLDVHGNRIEGVEEVKDYLQQLMDKAIERLNGSHFDIAEPIRAVEAMIAPSGSAAAPYYTPPSVDFSRPGRTWLPTLGQEVFPTYDLISTWYHEGVPGHHLQLAQWKYVADDLSLYQTSIGSNSAVTEGWALYAERLIDELGWLDDEARMGYLDCQIMRAIRVVIDIGMHLELTIPEDSPIAPGQTWTPELAEEFFAAHSGRPADFIASEIVRYLGWPGQAISYKLGERAWLEGRAAAQQAAADRGEEWDAKAWHMAALSLGAVSLADLPGELGQL